MTESRIERLRKVMSRQGVDAVLVVPSANLFYLTGLHMHLSERITLAVIPREGQAHLIVPALEVPRVEARATVPLILHAWTDAEWDQAGWNSLKRALALDGRNVAVDYFSVRALELTRLQTFAPGVRISDASPLMDELRMVKDASEVAAMRRAAQVLESSIEALIPELTPGTSEKTIAARWQWLMFEHGADGIPDSPIVASGPNSAQPHTTATAREIGSGELLTLDGWCPVDGYYGDITRTFAIGAVPDELKKIYAVTLAANEAGRAAGKPGVTGQDVDRAARQVVREAGYGDFFLHRTGHGLGLDIHESPNMMEGDSHVLRPGVTYTIEPGIYLAGKGGVRIEDDVVITENGSESLTVSSRELRVL